MLNIQKYKEQLKNCKNDKELFDFIRRYKNQDECVIDWLSRECIYDHDNTEEYLKATSIPPLEERTTFEGKIEILGGVEWQIAT